MEPENLDHIKVVDIGELVYCDPHVGDAAHAIVDTRLQPQSGDMVATVNLNRQRAIKYCKYVKQDAELIVGTVIELRHQGFRPPLLSNE